MTAWTPKQRNLLTASRHPEQDPKGYITDAASAWKGLCKVADQGERPETLTAAGERKRHDDLARALDHFGYKPGDKSYQRWLVNFWYAAAGLDFAIDRAIEYSTQGEYVVIHGSRGFWHALRRVLFAAPEADFAAARAKMEPTFLKHRRGETSNDATLRDRIASAFGRDERWARDIAEANLRRELSAGDAGAILSALTDPDLALRFAKARTIYGVDGPFVFDLLESLEGAAIPVLESVFADVTRTGTAKEKKLVTEALEFARQLAA